MIKPIQPTTNIKYNNNCNYHSSTKFTGRSVVSAEKSVRNVEFGLRIIVNKISSVFDKKETDILYQSLNNIDKKSPEYIHKITKISKYFAPEENFFINLEDKRIEEIAGSRKPHIFIMNHDNQSKDPKMLSAFNSFLNMEYLKTNQAATCPRPKIILNEDILLSMNKKNREIFTNLGAIPIDASVVQTDKKTNAKQFIGIIRDFIKGEANIFIFPEGKNSIKKNASLEDKFQIGVGEMVAKLADRLPEVNVTPIGFAYGGRFGGGDSIYIGKTITFKNQSGAIVSSSGNVKSIHADKWFKNFFKNENEAVLTENKIAVKGKERANYISGILCENLRICKEEAKSFLPDKKDKHILLIG